MATPNYSYEKRQRELAKKRKAEEKRQRKLERANTPAEAGTQDNVAAEPAPPPAGDNATR